MTTSLVPAILKPCAAIKGGQTFVPDVVTPEMIREKVFQFEERLAQCPGALFGDSDLCPLKHSFAEGMYVREIFIPAGTLLAGKIHRHAHPNFLMKGSVTVVTEGGGVENMTAPRSIISTAGTKRVVFAHEDTVWITVHHVGDERDLKKIEEMVIAPDYAQLEQKGFSCLG